MDLGYRGKTCLITASTGGIGFAIASAMAKEGAKVAINGRTRESVNRAIDRLCTSIPAAEPLAVVGNAATAEGCAEIIQSVPEVDVLVLNLGIYEAVDIFSASDEHWLELVQTNVMSGVRLARHYVPIMLQNDAGRVIFIASESAVNPAPELPAYSATKTMQLSVARNLAEAVKGSRVTINAVLPGPTRTEGVANLVAGLYPGLDMDEAEMRFIADNRPTSLIQRLTAPEEIGDVVAFLASERTAIINGAALRIDGGLIRTVV